jgi:nucleotide-binding universal stress UspA family protein
LSAVPAGIAGRGLLAAGILCGTLSIAFAAEENISGQSGATFIADLAILLIVGRGLGELADRYDARVRTALRVDVAAEDAILKEAERGGYDLIVLGVARRPGETLFFGNMAAAVLERCDTAVVFVAS